MAKYLPFLFFLFLHLPQASYGLDAQCIRRIFEHHYLNSPESGLDFAVVDIGSSTAKLYIKKSSTGEIFTRAYLIPLGESLGKTGTIDEYSFHKLQEELNKISLEITHHKLPKDQVQFVATAGMRDAQNSKILLNRLKSSGFPIKILSEQEESALVYRAVLKDQVIPRAVLKDQVIPHADVVVIEVGGGSTEIVFGKNGLEISSEKSTVIKAGSGSLGIANPYQLEDIEEAAARTRSLLQKGHRTEIKGQPARAYLASGSSMKLFRDIHLQKAGEDIFKLGLNESILNRYLSETGLLELKRISLLPEFSQVQDRIQHLPSKLLVLREVKNHYGLGVLHFGGNGGMKSALAEEFEVKLIGREIDRSTQRMVKHWMDSEDEIIDKMTEIFEPLDYGTWNFRVKQVHSLESKLTTKWIKGLATIKNLKKASFAHEMIGDGVGGRLTLDHSTEADMAKFYARLIQAVKEKDIRITEVHNYRAPGVTPYFNETQISGLTDAVEKANKRKLFVRDGVQAEKASGYTALHFNIVDKKGVPLEIQIRGNKMSELAEYEHDLYDIRQGKAAESVSPKLVSTVQKLSQSEQESLLSYIRKCYTHAREAEQNHLTQIPTLPPELSAYPELLMKPSLLK